MTSTIDDAIDSNDESHLKAVKAQILCMRSEGPRRLESKTDYMTANLRLLKPDLRDPIITSAFEKNKNIGEESEGAGLWTASIWNDNKEVIYSTYGIHTDLVAAMRTLLRLTSVAVVARLDKWQKTRSAVYMDDGVKYD